MRTRGSRGTRRLLRPLIAAVSVTALASALVPGAGAFDLPAPFDALGVKGFANGQTVHVGALESGGTRVVDAEVAWAAAAVDDGAAGLSPAKVNEMNRVFQPALTDKHTYARGSGLEVGLATSVDDPTTEEDEGENQIIQGGKTQSSAPPPPPVEDENPAQDELVSLDADPLAFAAVLRSNTVANWNDSALVPGACVLTDDVSRGSAYAADVELLDADASGEDPEGLEMAVLSLDDENPARAVSQNTTRTSLVPTGIPNNFGLMSEVRQTIAPVTLLADDTPDVEEARLLTIELLGEWVLRVTATGQAGGATVHYGPGEASPETPLVRIIDSAGEVTNVLTTQQLFGEGALPIPLIDIPSLLTVTIGENPRAIAAPGTMPDPNEPPTLAPNGTLASAAVDVVRVKLLSQVGDDGIIDPEAADIRVGHMEVSAQVPPGGIDCPIPVDKSANPVEISVGQTSRITLTVHNPYDCPLENVVLTDVISQKEGDPKFTLTASNPATTLPTGEVESATVSWSLGTVPPGGSKEVTLDILGVTGGIIEDIATAQGDLADCKGQAASGLAVADLKLVGVSPRVELAIETPRTGAPAAATTATGSILALVATALGVIVRRRIR